MRDDALRWLLFIAFLPYESQLMLDAILTTLRRLFTRQQSAAVDNRGAYRAYLWR